MVRPRRFHERRAQWRLQRYNRNRTRIGSRSYARRSAASGLPQAGELCCQPWPMREEGGRPPLGPASVRQAVGRWRRCWGWRVCASITSGVPRFGHRRACPPRSGVGPVAEGALPPRAPPRGGFPCPLRSPRARASQKGPSMKAGLVSSGGFHFQLIGALPARRRKRLLGPGTAGSASPGGAGVLSTPHAQGSNHAACLR